MIEAILLVLMLLNTAGLFLVLVALGRMVRENRPPTTTQKIVPDNPKPRAPNYADAALTRPLGKDIVLLRDD